MVDSSRNLVCSGEGPQEGVVTSDAVLVMQGKSQKKKVSTNKTRLLLLMLRRAVWVRDEDLRGSVYKRKMPRG